MKFLIAGLGNIGDEYQDTRHNIGFAVLDAFANETGTSFSDKRYGFIGRLRLNGHEVILLKPSTFMNLSGNAVSYWLKKENIPPENLLVIVDDIALPTGSIRIRPKGSDGGHNGLAHITTMLGTMEYARIRFGIGNNFRKGGQINYVLGTWDHDEKDLVEERIKLVTEMIRSFVLSGLEITMTAFNKAGKTTGKENAGEKSPE